MLAVFAGPFYFLTWRFNHEIFMAINGFQSNLIGLPMILFTVLADGHFVIMLSALAYQKKRRYYWSFIIAWLVVSAIVHLIKYLHISWRPLAYYHDSIFYAGEILTGQSFPSGHASAVMSLTRYLMQDVQNKKISLAFFFFGVICALSRVYIGVHFPVDVLAGGFIGFGLTHLVLVYAGVRFRRIDRREYKYNFIIIFSAGLTSAVSYIIFARESYSPISGFSALIAASLGIYFLYHIFFHLLNIYRRRSEDIHE